MLAELFQKGFLRFWIIQHVKHELLLAGRKSGFGPVQFPAAGVFLLLAPEADNAWPPHDGLFACGALHYLDYFKTIFAFLLILNCVQEIFGIDFCRAGFGFGSHDQVYLKR